jgi:hypothetical protein
VVWGGLLVVVALYSYRLALHPQSPHWMGFTHREARLADRLRYLFN